MSELKPIEPGCMAMIINEPEHTGKVVTVIDYMKPKDIVIVGNVVHRNSGKHNVWLVFLSATEESYTLGAFETEKLMRIDSYDKNELFKEKQKIFKDLKESLMKWAEKMKRDRDSNV